MHLFFFLLSQILLHVSKHLKCNHPTAKKSLLHMHRILLSMKNLLCGNQFTTAKHIISSCMCLHMHSRLSASASILKFKAMCWGQIRIEKMFSSSGGFTVCDNVVTIFLLDKKLSFLSLTVKEHQSKFQLIFLFVWLLSTRVGFQ